MPDHDELLSQGTVDERNEARNPLNALPVFVCRNPEQAWIDEQRETAGDEADGENPRYGPGNPDWEHDREREEIG